MKLFTRLAVIILANAAGLAIARYIPGFTIENGWRGLLALTLVFTVLNLFLKQFLKLLFGPLIIITLGLALFFINALILFILDLLSKNLTIQGTLPLLIATFVM